MPVPVPLTLKVVALVKVSVTGWVRLAAAGGVTDPTRKAPLPRFAELPAARTGKAAAINAGSEINALMPAAAARVGATLKLSPAAGAPLLSASVTPSTVCGRLVKLC